MDGDVFRLASQAEGEVGETGGYQSQCSVGAGRGWGGGEEATRDLSPLFLERYDPGNFFPAFYNVYVCFRNEEEKKWEPCSGG